MPENELKLKIEAAQRKLVALERSGKAMELERKRKESLLSQLEDQINDLHKRKRMVLDRVKEVNAETDTVRSYLHSVEHLDMLEGMLFERKTKLLQQQSQRNTLLQQLTELEVALEHPRGQPHVCRENSEENSCTQPREQWEKKIDLLRCNAKGMYRFFHNSMSYALDHPATVFHQSVRKMSRMARDREVELAMLLEGIDTNTQQTILQENTLARIEHEYRQEVANMQRNGRSMLQAMGETAEAEVNELRHAIQLAVQERQELQNCLGKGLRPHNGVGLPPQDNMLRSKEPQSGFVDHEKGRMHDGGNYTEDKLQDAAEERAPKSAYVVNGKRAGSLSASDADMARHSSTSGEECFPLPCGDSELDGLRRQVATMERYADRMHKRYEALEGEVAQRFEEHNANIKKQEVKLREASEAAVILQKERLEWKALKKQMSLLAR